MPVLNLFKFWIFTIMAASFKLQYLIIISVFLHLRSSYGFPHHLLYNGVHIITYGKPCYSSYQLPVTIEVLIVLYVLISCIKSFHCFNYIWQLKLSVCVLYYALLLCHAYYNIYNICIFLI